MPTLSMNQPSEGRHSCRPTLDSAATGKSPLQSPWSQCAFLALALGFAPQNLLACAACFGQTDDRLAQGMNAGIFTLLGIIVGVLIGVAAFMIYLARRTARASSAPAVPAESKT